MKRIFFFALLWAGLSCSAQTSGDSLLNKIKTYPKRDSVRVELLIDACVGGIFRADSLQLSYALEALDISEKTGYRLGRVRSLNCIGNYYYNRADFGKAIDYYTRALRIAEASADPKNIMISKSNLANVYAHSGKQFKAIELFRECDVLLKNMNDTLSQNRAALLTNLATAWSSLNRHDSAVVYYREVLRICEAKQIAFGIGLTLLNLASEYYSQGKYREAIDALERAYPICNENKMDFLLPAYYKTLGSSQIATGQVKEGIRNLEQAAALSRSSANNESLVEVYRRLHPAYVLTGDFRMAYQTALSYYAMKDSIFSIERDKALNEISTRYETEKKEAAIRQLKQDNEITALLSQRKTVVIYSILGGIAAISLIAYFLFSRYRSNKQNEMLRLRLEEARKTLDAEKKAAESELKALKSQMNPHFIFNALNTIQEQFMYGDKLKANEQLGNFTYLTRQILTVSGKKLITLGTEKDILIKYLELEKMRFTASFTYEVISDESIDEDYTQLPPMLIQPFVENSIKHGLMHKPGEKKLSVRFEWQQSEECLLCTIEDNGVGRKRAAEIRQRNESKHNSFSTESIEQRLELLNKELRLKDLIVFEDLEDEAGEALGTRVRIKIPLI